MKNYTKEELLKHFSTSKTYFPGMFNSVLNNLSLQEFLQFVTDLKKVIGDDKTVWANALNNIGYTTNKDTLESVSPADTVALQATSKDDRVYHQKVKIIAQAAYGIEYDKDWEKNYAANASKSVNDKAAKYIYTKNKIDQKNHLTTEQKIMLAKRQQMENS